jgi:uncharacterized protein (TIGR03437 family)
MQLLTDKILKCALSLCLVSAAWAGTFGKVVPIGGHASDIAVDERRGVVYVSNFTANRIEVMSMANETLATPMEVALQPASLALSPDNRYLVVAHYDLDGNVRQHLVIGPRVLAVAFGGSPLALVVTEQGLQILDPATGTLQDLAPQPFTSQGLPVPFATFPPEIVQASANTSRDGRYVVGLAQYQEMAVSFRFDVFSRELIIISIRAEPPLGPRVVSVNFDGSVFLLGWGMFDFRGVLLAQFPAPDGAFHLGSHAYDSARALVYAQIPEGTETNGEQGAPATSAVAPVLHIMDADNLTVRERLRLPENLAGKAIIRGDSHVMYSVSDSGVMILPIGELYAAHRVIPTQEDVVFRCNFCDRRVFSQEIDIVNPTGGVTDFSLSVKTNGITVSPSSGTTPTRVKITVDPNLFQNQKGTTTAFIEIKSVAAVNIPLPVRVLINSREPEQRGAFYNVPGKLVDILADAVRNRFYVIRQDKNQVLVFDGTGFNLITTLRTGNTPTQMAITRDLRYLIVGNDNSQIANVYDLDTLQPSEPIIFPFGHYPRSIAVSNRGMFGAVRGVSLLPQCEDQTVAAGPNTIDRIDFATRTATTACTLGIYTNSTDADTVLASSPSGSMIFGAMPDGTVLLYDASADTFVASRKDFQKLSGAYAALTDQMFVVDNNLLNWSLVPFGALKTDTGASSGFALVDGFGLRTASPAAASPGVIERVDLLRLESIRPTKTVESPLTSTSLLTPPVGQIGQSILPFTRTLAPLANRVSIVSLTTSGFTVLPWNFDVALAKPNIERVVNLADGSTNVAPGGLISVFGTNLSSVTASNTELPVPTTLGESCMTINGILAPLFFASPMQVNAQLPFEVSGSATMILRAPGGTSNSFNFTVLPSAPAIFHTGTAGPDTGLPTIFRATNNELVTLSNPIHPEDIIVIFATGLGYTSPAVPTGHAAPSDPLALAQIQPVITIGGVPLEVQFAGLVPGQVGVYQINARVPYTVPRGMQVPMAISLGEQQVTLNVRVVK